ncbi:hypothetical protein DXG03_006514 [Asterophora parasitica]|uniref:Uncharacterized protein n=1 Tax=Asterophora parasitica TaxID=117018 RepID=A0A9P7GDH4_9AGAR|nr:hypothetical protein DXG03_006514 [Asterophora parasitica]
MVAADSTLCIAAGIIYGILFISKQITQSFENTKDHLKNKGLTISHKGVSVKTARRFDREDYVDATQRCALHLPFSPYTPHPWYCSSFSNCRGFVKAVNAASFGKGNGFVPTSGPSKVQRTGSSSSAGSAEEKKKRAHLFRRSNDSKEKI